jgi:hypothetical protein
VAAVSISALGRTRIICACSRIGLNLGQNR